MSEDVKTVLNNELASVKGELDNALDLSEREDWEALGFTLQWLHNHLARARSAVIALRVQDEEGEG